MKKSMNHKKIIKLDDQGLVVTMAPPWRDWKILCPKCSIMKITYGYQAHFFCVSCRTLLGFPDSNGHPSKWNDDCTDYIKLKAEIIDWNKEP